MNGVRFGNIRSYNDLHLILEPFTPTPATPQLNLLKIPGRDGLLDLTEANGEVKYNSREFTFNFTIAPGDTLTFDERVTAVSNALNGLQGSIRLDRDPGYIWRGRCSVDKYEQDKNIKRIVVKAVVDPYKYKTELKTVTGTLSATNTSTHICNNTGKMTTIPTIRCNTDGVQVWLLGGETYTLKLGDNRIPGIRLVTGRTPLQMRGNGTVTISWQEGDL